MKKLIACLTAALLLMLSACGGESAQQARTTQSNRMPRTVVSLSHEEPPPISPSLPL